MQESLALTPQPKLFFTLDEMASPLLYTSFP